jgi:hypothetical protein
MSKKPNANAQVYTVLISVVGDVAAAVVMRSGRSNPIHYAVRPTRERAVLAVLNGAGIDWVPGTKTASRGGRTIGLEFRDVSDAFGGLGAIAEVARRAALES